MRSNERCKAGCKAGQTDLVFGMRPWFIGTPVHAGLHSTFCNARLDMYVRQAVELRVLL